MKTNSEIKNMLGLSQQEMAKLLGTTRTQWAMYEIGQRDLPLSAIQKMGEVLQYVQQSKSDWQKQFMQAEQEKEKEWLQQEYKAQSYKLELLYRKIHTMEHHRQKSYKALEVLSYLEQFPDDITCKDLALDIRERLEESFSKNNSSKLQELYFQKQTSEMLKLNLEEKIKSTS